MDAPLSNHQPVMLREAIEALEIQPNGVYIDATFGRGGHSTAILDGLGANGHLLALDRDPAAEQFAHTRFIGDPRFIFVRCTFSRLGEIVDRYKMRGRVQGILLDLGVSSPQLEESQRGFSFTKEGPLDMRMDPTTGMSAAEWLASCPEETLSRVLKGFGEERFHRRIARAIVRSRQESPITTTAQLARLIAAVMPFREPTKHPATRSFQAIRIVVNQELEELKAALGQALQVLAPQGRLVVISFQSLEDRIVKRFMREQSQGRQLPPELPVLNADSGRSLRLIGRALHPSQAETTGNPRARSAVMRVAERLA